MAAEQEIWPTSFLDLPAELRLSIYELALDDILKEPEDPWAQAPPHSRFSTFWSLALTAPQVGEEVRSLFEKVYSHLAQFYFSDVCSLQDFQQYASGQKALKDVSFNLTTHSPHLGGYYGLDRYEYYSDDPGNRAWAVEAEATWAFVRRGLGFDEFWYKFDTVAWRAGWSDNSLNADHLARLLPEEFKLSSYVHNCLAQDPSSYHTIVFPPSPHDLKLTLHRGDRRSTVMKLSGRLQDLIFEGIDMDELRANVYHACGFPWRYHVSRNCSPDLDSEERQEMDADSWGVPDEEPEEEEDRIGIA